MRISQATQSHYLPLRGHFEALAGKTGVPTLNALVAHADDPDRQVVSQAIRTALAAFSQIPDIHHKPTGPFRAESYLLAIANSRAIVKVGTVREILDTWPVKKIWTLVYTLRNRTNAQLDRGHTRARNKSQRKS